jgi:hypothetical protein
MMHKKILVLALILTLAIDTYVLRTSSSQTISEKGPYVTVETNRAIYRINQFLYNLYGQENFSSLLKIVDDRFDYIRNITLWSSEKFYKNKLEVTVEPASPESGSEGTGDYGSARILISPDFLTNKTYEKSIVNLFLHEMTHGITPPTIRARGWLTEGFAVFLSNEVQVFFGDRTQAEADGLYDKVWRQYVENGYLDFFFNLNRTIQDGYGSYITAWMLNNITKTYGWATHERFFSLLPDEFLFFMPSFPSLSVSESLSYNYYLDSLIVGYYSQAAGTSLFSSFKSWGVKSLPNPITTISINGADYENRTYFSPVEVSLSAAGENEISKIEYSFDKKTWSTYAEPFSVSDDGSVYCRSTDNAGNTGVTSSITLTFAESNVVPSMPFPATLIITGSVVAVAAVAGLGLFVYFKKHKH